MDGQNQESPNTQAAATAEPTLAELTAIIKKQQAQINILTSVVKKGAETKEQAAEVKTPQIPKETVKRDDKEFKFTCASFSLAGHGKFSAEEALVDDDILDLIFDIKGQGILKEVF